MEYKKKYLKYKIKYFFNKGGDSMYLLELQKINKDEFPLLNKEYKLDDLKVDYERLVKYIINMSNDYINEIFFGVHKLNIKDIMNSYNINIDIQVATHTIMSMDVREIDLKFRHERETREMQFRHKSELINLRKKINQQGGVFNKIKNLFSGYNKIFLPKIEYKNSIENNITFQGLLLLLTEQINIIIIDSKLSNYIDIYLKILSGINDIDFINLLNNCGVTIFLNTSQIDHTILEKNINELFTTIN